MVSRVIVEALQVSGGSAGGLDAAGQQHTHILVEEGVSAARMEVKISDLGAAEALAVTNAEEKRRGRLT